MKDRCYNKRNVDYHNYGLIGTTVCKEWLDDFSLFNKWYLKNYKDGKY
jgi:hypothetical protein